jgi:hypothetical protein
MTRRVDYVDEIAALQNRAGQAVTNLAEMASDLRYVEPAFAELKTLSRNFKPVPPSHDILRINANVKVADPREECEILERKLRLTLANLDRAAALLKERQDAITTLLR